MKRPVILLTGGGTAGHVSVNQALIPVFSEKGYEIHYIGSHKGIEKELIGNGHPEVIYHAIQSGKTRRYFSMKNFTDPFRVGAGVLQALADHSESQTRNYFFQRRFRISTCRIGSETGESSCCHPRI